MKVRRADGCTTDIKKLKKSYPSVAQDILYFERLLESDSTTGHIEYSGLKLRRGNDQAHVFKARVMCRYLQSKSGGIRYIYEQLTDSAGHAYAVGLVIYVHQQGASESDIQQLIKQRHATFEISGLNSLFRPDLALDEVPER